MKKSSIFLWQSELFHSLSAPPSIFGDSKLQKMKGCAERSTPRNSLSLVQGVSFIPNFATVL
jgi:hypothetical protein